MRTSCWIITSIFALSVAGAVETAFTTKPAVRRDGDGYRISFAVSAPAAVEVAVLDEKGKVVRHLVAGLLGNNPPKPLQKGSLSQELFWGGKDDDGKLVSPLASPKAAGETSDMGTGFRVRIRLGLELKLEEYLFNEPGRIERSVECSLAVDRQGNLYYGSCPGYASSGGARWSARGMLLRVYDRNGKYIRTIVPFPANLRPDQLKGTGAQRLTVTSIPFGTILTPSSFTRSVQRKVMSLS